MPNPDPTDIPDIMRGEVSSWVSAGRPADEHTTLHHCSREHPNAGLPLGWTRVADWCSKHPNYCWTLTRRGAGGWALVRYNLSPDRVLVVRAAADLSTLHATSTGPDREPSQGTGRPWDGVPAWINRTIADMYDTSDPDEAANQVLFALSGQLHRPPKAVA